MQTAVHNHIADFVADQPRATMDSGPNGDSFLAPRMLPDPDEAGDYRWPVYCKPSPFSSIYPAELTKLFSRSPNPHSHHTFPMVFSSLPNRQQGPLRHRHFGRSTYSGGIRQSLDPVPKAISQRIELGEPAIPSTR